jgi:fatty acid desaturase
MKRVGIPPAVQHDQRVTHMMPHDNPPPQRRETMLTVVLSGLAAGACLFFLILISGGFIFYVLLAVAGIFALGFFHYLLWGYAMTQEVADEQARAAAQRQHVLDNEMLSDKIQHKRF